MVDREDGAGAVTTEVFRLPDVVDVFGLCK